MRYVHVALDDADSHYGGCTTYVTYKILKELMRVRDRRFEIVSLPLLVRLNPYIPFKTRGNAATRLTFKIPEDLTSDLIETILNLVDKYSEHRGKASPGVAVLVTESVDVPEELRWLYLKAVRDVISIDIVEKISTKLNIKIWGGRGKVGAVAALGASFNDSTFELLVYGSPEAKERLTLDLDYVLYLDRLTCPLTFANVDLEDCKILLMPAGPDPVLLGVRGDSPVHIIMFALGLLPYMYDVVEGWLLYRTNQATEIHVENVLDESYTYMPERELGVVLQVERTEARHLKVETTGSKLFLYRHLGEITSLLERGTGLIVEWWGGKRLCLEGYYTYIEGARVLSTRLVEVRNPTCPRCGARLKSAGRSELRCEKCGYSTGKGLRELHLAKLDVKKLLLLPKLSEHRHLMKPTSRIGLEGLALEFPDFPPYWIL